MARPARLYGRELRLLEERETQLETLHHALIEGEQSGLLTIVPFSGQPIKDSRPFESRSMQKYGEFLVGVAVSNLSGLILR